MGLVALFAVAAAGVAYVAIGSDDEIDRTPVVRSAPPPVPPPPVQPVLPPPPSPIAALPPAEAGPCGPDMEPFDEVEGDGTRSSGCGRRIDGNRSREGTWTMHDVRGFTLEGKYVDGLREGRWTAWYPNGALFQYVDFVHGRKNGFWVQWGQDGRKLFEHAYRDDVLDGTSTDYSPDGTTQTSEYKDGRRVGP